MTDPEARIMKQPDGGYAPAYNLQLSTDAACAIIVEAGVSQRSDDFKELVPALERIEENTGKKPTQVVADGGFTSRENILAMEARGVDFIGSPDGSNPSAGQCKNRGVDPVFWPEHFSYDEKNNTYTCPPGKTLRPQGKEARIGKTKYIYRAPTRDCSSCPHKEKCCPKAKRRSLIRSVDDPVVVSFLEKMKTEKAKAAYKQRGPIAEFPHAWIKEKIGLRQFHLRGLLEGRDGSSMGVSHLQYPAMDTSLLETWIGVNGKASTRREMKRTNDSRNQHEFSQRLQRGYHAFSVTIVLSADSATDGRLDVSPAVS